LWHTVYLSYSILSRNICKRKYCFKIFTEYFSDIFRDYFIHKYTKYMQNDSPAGIWFQLLIALFTKEYWPTSALCFLSVIFRLWTSQICNMILEIFFLSISKTDNQWMPHSQKDFSFKIVKNSFLKMLILKVKCLLESVDWVCGLCCSQLKRDAQ
jgi:hypothetical protein